jgi:enoyl-CoA hydratase/carnithine racemase
MHLRAPGNTPLFKPALPPLYLPCGNRLRTAMSSQLHAERRGHTLVLTVSDPATRNTLSEQVFAAGVEALNVAESDPELRAVVLRGDGAHFCAGGNLQRLAHNRAQAPEVQGETLSRFQQFVEAIQAFPKPVIAAVEGYAAGGGFSLALACDLIVAASDAKFVLSYGRIGVSPDGGASWQLMQRLPRALVLQWLWLPEPVSAPQLHQLGLVNWVSDNGRALDEALAVAERLAQCAPNALASVKELVNQWPQGSLPAQMALENKHFLGNLFHPNAAEGLQAFAQKRPPDFKAVG